MEVEDGQGAALGGDGGAGGDGGDGGDGLGNPQTSHGGNGGNGGNAGSGGHGKAYIVTGKSGSVQAVGGLKGFAPGSLGSGGAPESLDGIVCNAGSDGDAVVGFS